VHTHNHQHPFIEQSVDARDKVLYCILLCLGAYTNGLHMYTCEDVHTYVRICMHMYVLLQKHYDLCDAAMSGNEAVVKELIQLGVDLDVFSAVSFALLILQYIFTYIHRYVKYIRIITILKL